MPIGQCRACGKPVSTIPALCPHCGVAQPIPPGELTSPEPESPVAGPPSPTPPRERAPIEPAFTITSTHWGLAVAVVVAVASFVYWLHQPELPRLPNPAAALKARQAATAPTVAPAPPPAPAPSAPVAVTPVDTAMFEAAYRAEKSIEGGLAGGVSYKDFDALLQAFATEVVAVKDRAPGEPEQALLRRYGEVLITYQDSRALWREQLDQGVKYGWASAPERNPDALIVVEGDVPRIVQRYGLATRGGPDGSAALSPEAIPLLWERARSLFAAANRSAGVADSAPGDSPR
jgi:hypothetical protein